MTNGKDPMGSITKEFDLLERHILILKTVKESQPVGIIVLSERTGIPKHKVRYSLKLLEQEGLITATNEGAMVTDQYDVFMEEISGFAAGLHQKVQDLMDKLRS